MDAEQEVDDVAQAECPVAPAEGPALQLSGSCSHPSPAMPQPGPESQSEHVAATEGLAHVTADDSPEKEERPSMGSDPIAHGELEAEVHTVQLASTDLVAERSCAGVEDDAIASPSPPPSAQHDVPVLEHGNASVDEDEIVPPSPPHRVSAETNLVDKKPVLDTAAPLSDAQPDIGNASEPDVSVPMEVAAPLSQHDPEAHLPRSSQLNAPVVKDVSDNVDDDDFVPPSPPRSLSAEMDPLGQKSVAETATPSNDAQQAVGNDSEAGASVPMEVAAPLSQHQSDASLPSSAQLNAPVVEPVNASVDADDFVPPSPPCSPSADLGSEGKTSLIETTAPSMDAQLEAGNVSDAAVPAPVEDAEHLSHREPEQNQPPSAALQDQHMHVFATSSATTQSHSTSMCPNASLEQTRGPELQTDMDVEDTATQCYADLPIPSLSEKQSEVFMGPGGMDIEVATQQYSESLVPGADDMPPPPPPCRLPPHNQLEKCQEVEDSPTQQYFDSCPTMLSSFPPGSHDARVGSDFHAVEEDAATQQYTDLDTGVVELAMPPPPRPILGKKRDFRAVEDDTATQQYADLDTGVVEAAMPPPPRPIFSKKRDSCALAADMATQEYSDSAIAGLAMPPPPQILCSKTDFGLADDDVATQHYTDMDDGLANLAMPPPPRLVSGTEGVVCSGLEESATQNYTDLGGVPVPTPCMQADRYAIDDVEVPITQCYADGGSATLSRVPKLAAGGQTRDLQEETCVTQCYSGPGLAFQEEICVTQCYSGLQFAGPVCIVPDDGGSSQEEDAVGGQARGAAASSSSLGAAPKWRTRPPAAAANKTLPRKRPAAAPCADPAIERTMPECPAAASSAGDRRPRKRAAVADMGSPKPNIAEFPRDAIIRRTGQKVGAEYMQKRCDGLDGLTVSEALQSPPYRFKDTHGVAQNYTQSHLRYDIKAGRLALDTSGAKLEDFASTPKRRIREKRPLTTASAALSKATPVKEASSNSGLPGRSEGPHGKTSGNRFEDEAYGTQPYAQSQAVSGKVHAQTAKSLFEDEDDDDPDAAVVWLGQARREDFAAVSAS